MNNSVFEGAMKNIREHRNIRLVTTDKTWISLFWEPNYHTTFLAIEMNKTKVKINKLIYLGLAILDISKTVMHKFWCGYIKPQYQDKANLCYIDITSSIVNIKTKDIYRNIANDVEKRFDTWNYGIERPLPTSKNKKVILLNLVEKS